SRRASAGRAVPALAALLAAVTLATLAPGRARAADPLIERADDQYARGEYRRAAELYAARVRGAPGDAQAHLKLAFAYQAMGDRERSAIAGREAASLTPDAATAWFPALRDRVLARRLDEALVLARELARLLPADCDALRMAGTL